MKAVIMAGGKGSRLRPLTVNLPKPMVPLLDRPCMEYTIELLKKHDITDIAVTLQYLPETIRQYFGDGSEWGVHLHYFEEDTPLGTAGSVIHAREFLDETFIVISGDAVTDFALDRAVDFHREKGAEATLVLARVENPLEFGVVMTDDCGRIIRFLEKPSWGEVFSDTVNTGIYILEPQVLQGYDQATEYDFSKDLFPHMLSEQKPLYGYAAAGYWSDIGNLGQYRQTQFDMLEGKVNVDIHGTELSPGIWIGKHARIADTAMLTAPCFIGSNTIIEEHVRVGGYSVIGEGSVLNAGVSLDRAMLLKHVFLDRGSEVYGATVCKHATLMQGAVVYDGAVLGAGCKIGVKSVVQPGIKVFPNKSVGSYMTLNRSLIWGEEVSKGLFGYHGIKGVCNVDMTTGFVHQLALAYGSVLPIGSTVAIGFDAAPFSYLLSETFASALHAAGINTCHFEKVTSAVIRYGTYYFGCEGGVVIRRDSTNNEEFKLEFLDDEGIPIGKARERKIENCFFQEDFRLVKSSGLGKRIAQTEITALYKENLLEMVSLERIRTQSYKVVLQYDHRSLQHIIPELLEKLGCSVIQVNRGTGSDEMSKLVCLHEADIGIVLDSDAQQIELISEQGTVIRDEMVSLLQLLVQIYGEDKRTLYIPVHLPDIAEMLAEKLNRTVVRTKMDMRSIIKGCENQGFHIYVDGLYTLVQIMQMMAVQGKSLSGLLASIPDFTLIERRIDCHWSEKGRVMRFLMEETKGRNVELIDGLKVHHEQGWTLILPDCDEPGLRIFSNAKSLRQAEEMALMYISKITDCRKSAARM